MQTEGRKEERKEEMKTPQSRRIVEQNLSAVHYTAISEANRARLAYSLVMSSMLPGPERTVP